MEFLTKVIGTIGLYVILWAGLCSGILIIKETFFKKVDDWFTGPIIAVVVSTVVTAGVFVYNHVSFNF